MQNLSNRPSCKTDATILTRTYNLNLYYPLPRKSGSINLSFPAQMCNLSNSNQKECMGIALHHAGNKDTFYLPERNFTFYAKIQCKNMPQKVYVAKSEAKYITQKFGCKICPQKFTKRPRGRAVSAPDFGSRGRGFESRWR